jgi:hypothetical protein
MALLSTVLVALAAAWAGCTTSSENPTGCVVAEVDAGSANDVVCNIGWACNSGSEHYQLICTAGSDDTEQCVCTSDQNDLSPTFHPQSFVCQGTMALAVLNACGGWDLQM